MISTRIGPYLIDRKLGEGGMGVVYEAIDDRLGRRVAIKMLRGDAAGSDREQQQKRLWREARIAARMNHPNLCQIHDVLDHEGTLFLVMELLQGSTLSERLKSGPMTLAEGVGVMRGILAALQELHRSQIIHRDLKPSNVFIGAHGVKLLDFGLAQGAETPGGPDDTLSMLSLAGAITGTPRYMAPEQLHGAPLTPASDLFAAGCIFYELLAGKPAFEGNSVAQILNSVLNGNPPALSGPPPTERADATIRRALQKQPAERFASAAEMDAAISALGSAEPGVAPRAGLPKKLIALPLRMLRPDPDTEFLAFSLPDAITCSLAGLGSIIVRSTTAGARYDSGGVDLKRIANECDVDVVLVGSLMRAGDSIRVSTQLIEAPSGTVLWSEVANTKLGDLFQLQDQLVDRIVQSLTVPLTARERRALKHDVPASAFAYECFLRANQILSQLVGMFEREPLTLARDLYLRSVEDDPGYAPAWAQLGRAHRSLAKFHTNDPETLRQAEDAFRKAFEINPDLPMAHHYYTGLETDSGRALQAMRRLLGRAQLMPNDANLFAGLGQACRYCGLLDASLAAFERARQIDPKIPVSLAWTYLALGMFQKASEASADPFIRCAAQVLMGRAEDAVGPVRQHMQTLTKGGIVWAHVNTLLGFLEGDPEKCLAAADDLVSRLRDPEPLFHITYSLIGVGADARALEILRSVIDTGYWCSRQLRELRCYDPLRGNPEFEALVQLAESRRQEARLLFLEAGGDRVLGLTSVA